VFFQLSEKQPIVLWNQPVVLLLGVLKKVENVESSVIKSFEESKY